MQVFAKLHWQDEVTGRWLPVPVNGIGGGSSGSSVDRELITTTYRATSSGTGYTVGDTITATRVYDVDGETITVVGSTTWFNETTGLVLASAPTSGHLSTLAVDAASETTLVLVKNAVDGLEVATGAPADAAAAADGTGDYGLIAGLKRALLNWATLLARTTTLGQKSMVGSMPVVLATDQSRVTVEPLGIPSEARQQATTTTSANVVLTTSARRISLFARGQPLRYRVGSTSQTANSATSHYLASGERVDINVPATPNIAVVRASDASADGAAEITELT